MKAFFALLLCWVSVSFAQIVTVPIPGAPGLSITVGTGVNALPLRDIRNSPNAVNITTSDDWYNEVPLGFTFPFFGRNFTTSWAATNGYVTFQDPQLSGLGGGCCGGVNLATTTDPRYNYTIYGVHTDLYSWNGANQWYLQEQNTTAGYDQMTYGWYNLSQCCSSQGGNSFEIKITSTGIVDTRIAGALVNWNPVTSGMSGDLTKGEYYQYYHGSGLNIVPGSPTAFSWNTNGGFTGADPCIATPLSSPTCPGYAAAYLTQQCTISALYDPTCPGYTEAYFTYQCSINPLYSQMCPGYATAYFNQQCSLDGLYDRNCPNYSTAYATRQALNQQNTVQTTTVTPVETAATPTTVALIADTNVNNVITNNTTAAAPSASPASVTTAVPLVQQPAQTTSPVSPAAVASQPASAPQPQSTQQAQPQQPTRGQQLQQARVEAARKEAASKGNDNMKEVKEAKSMEQQVATQGLIITAMGYNPSFDAYTSIVLKDTSFYKPFEIYKGKENVDNTRAIRGLYGPSEIRHQQLINQQYQ